jgi:hypothetical protein
MAARMNRIVKVRKFRTPVYDVRFGTTPHGFFGYAEIECWLGACYKVKIGASIRVIWQIINNYRSEVPFRVRI